VVLQEPPPSILCGYPQGSASPLPCRVIADFTLYVNQQIVVSNYAANAILNFDEAIIDFGSSPRSTLSKACERSLSICISSRLGKCTVMLWCSASGFKFHAFVIWNGVPNGHIDRETQGMAYHLRHTNKGMDGWMDVST
jgi:hypothetical protein